MKNGIAIGGNILVDHLKQIDIYPGEGMLTHIRSEAMSVGGCVSNTAISLKRLSPQLNVRAIGCIGDDHDAEYVKGVYQKNALDISGMKTLTGVPTGYTDVYATELTRTFFVNNGANARFSFEHMDFDRLDADILHMGYILLLDHMDSPDAEHGTVMARVLREAQRRGIKTSIDVVSEDSDRFCHIIPAALKYCDYVIINEIEAGRTAGIAARQPDDKLIWKNLPEICAALIDMGVSRSVVLHCPETSIWMDGEKNWIGMRSLILPKNYIKGSVGAGDAFCAGTLYGLYHGLSPKELLRLANSAAAGCLSCEDSISGVGTASDMLKLHERFAADNELWKL